MVILQLPSVVTKGSKAKASIAKEDGIICGLPVFVSIYHISEVEFISLVTEFR